MHGTGNIKLTPLCQVLQNIRSLFVLSTKWSYIYTDGLCVSLYPHVRSSRYVADGQCARTKRTALLQSEEHALTLCSRKWGSLQLHILNTILSAMHLI